MLPKKLDEDIARLQPRHRNVVGVVDAFAGCEIEGLIACRVQVLPLEEFLAALPV